MLVSRKAKVQKSTYTHLTLILCCQSYLNKTEGKKGIHNMLLSKKEETIRKHYKYIYTHIHTRLFLGKVREKQSKKE